MGFDFVRQRARGCPSRDKSLLPSSGMKAPFPAFLARELSSGGLALGQPALVRSARSPANNGSLTFVADDCSGWDTGSDVLAGPMILAAFFRGFALALSTS